VDVAAGDGHLVRLLVLQAEGGKRLSPAEFLAGRPLAPGMAFDLP
jgi:methionyl-tRNA formyltransferase